jgi:hypothetical protein
MKVARGELGADRFAATLAQGHNLGREAALNLAIECLERLLAQPDRSAEPQTAPTGEKR